MANLRLAMPIYGADFSTSDAEYQRSNTEVSLKADVIIDSLILGLDCNDNAANTTIIDRAGIQNGVSSANTNNLSTTDSIQNRALTFQQTQFATFADNPNWDTQNFTVSMWIKYLTARQNDQFFSRWLMTGGKRSWSFGTSASNSARLSLLTSADGTNPVALTASSDVLSTNTWTHIAVTYTAGSTSGGKLYVNGQPISTAGTVTTSLFISDAPLQLNGLNSNATNCANATYDIVSVYDRALSAAEIEAVYNAENEVFKTYPTETTVNPLQVDSGSNATVWDMSTFLTLVNPNGESGTVKFKYATDDTGNTIPDYADDDTAYSSTWLTLAQLQAETDPTAGCFRLVMQITGNGAQDGTVTDSSIVATITTTGGGEYSYTF